MASRPRCTNLQRVGRNRFIAPSLPRAGRPHRRKLAFENGAIKRLRPTALICGPERKASFALTGTGSKSNGSSHGSRRRSRSRQGPAGVTLHHEFGLKALDITIDRGNGEHAAVAL